MKPRGTGSGSPEILEPPFCRDNELRDIMTVISSEECRAVFLTSDSGMGASTLLRALASDVKMRVAVVAIHGTLSLATVPYGVLAPFITAEVREPLSPGISVLHSLLQEIQRCTDALPAQAQASAAVPIIVVDDAHYLDTATAEVLVKLVMSGTVNIVLSHSSRTRLPEPLPKLWSGGMAENITLNPLSQEQGHAFCEAMLGGPVRRATSEQFCSAAAGNPLLLRLAVEAAAHNGQLVRNNGWWISGPYLPEHGKAMNDVVRAQLRDLSDAGRAALNLVALAEPIEESLVREMVEDAAIVELQARRLVRHHHYDRRLLSLTSPIYGDVIREMVPFVHRRQLYEQLIQKSGDETPGREALLRRVIWALEVGADVPDDQLLKAAIFAGQLFQPATSLQLVTAIRASDYCWRASMVTARAKYDLGDYRGALSAMDAIPGDAENLGDLLFGSLLRAATRTALGLPVQAIVDDAQALREGGERLALNHPDQADFIVEHSRKHAMLLSLMVFSREGRYSATGPLAMVLVRTSKLSTPYAKFYRAVALIMDAERLTAQGFPLQALLRVKEALAAGGTDDDEVFFLLESILFRQLFAALCGGEWVQAAAALEQYSVEAGLASYSFGGGADVVRGMILLRSGKNAQALEILLPGMEALKISDPQQLLGFCTAMASYAAAKVGQDALAHRLAQEHVESTGMFAVVAHERAYLSAAAHILGSDAGGLAQLLMQADEAGANDSTMLELNALVLALELGEYSVAPRVVKVAGAVEGLWARSVQNFAAAVVSGDGLTLIAVAEQLVDADLLGLAQQAVALSATARKEPGQGPDANTMRQQLRRLASILGTEAPRPPAGTQPARPRLTRREREVANLAASGLGDRETAEKLKLSLRTVEGHLYRVYGKLGISTRTELPAALARLSDGQ